LPARPPPLRPILCQAIFQGHWQPDLDVVGNRITETNYQCDIRKIKLVKADPVDRTYQIDMRCTTFPPESSAYTRRVRSLWAIRGDVLVIITQPNRDRGLSKKPVISRATRTTRHHNGYPPALTCDLQNEPQNYQ
jgi:hypothetical protein